MQDALTTFEVFLFTLQMTYLSRKARPRQTSTALQELQWRDDITAQIPTVSESIVADALLPTLNTPSGSDISGDVRLAKKCEKVLKGS